MRFFAFAGLCASANAAWLYGNVTDGEGAWQAQPHMQALWPEAGFPACAGHQQSPIDIPLDAVVTDGSLGAVFPHFESSVPTLTNSGHSWMASDVKGASVIDGEEWNLLQWHVHTPSEHTVDGRQFPLEAHLVHANAAGDLAVLGILYEYGAADPALDLVWEQFGDEEHEFPANAGMNPRDLLPGGTGYWRYYGSLTTPPCSEGVKWTVFKSPRTVSTAQVQRLRDALGKTQGHQTYNNRVPQPINARTVVQTTPEIGC